MPERGFPPPRATYYFSILIVRVVVAPQASQIGGGVIGAIINAFIGAVILLVILRLIKL